MNIFINTSPIIIAYNVIPCSLNKFGPGVNPFAINVPNKIATAASPGIHNVNNGINVAPVTALLAASAAAIPSIEPFPNSSGCFADFFALS